MAKITLRPVHQMALFSVVCLLVFAALVQPMSPWFHPWYMALLPVLLIFGVWGVIVSLMMFSRERGAYREKAKRGGATLSAPDTYALIDRMLDNLDAEELDYLRRRLDEAQSRLAGDDWRESLDSVLEAREAARRVSKRR